MARVPTYGTCDAGRGFWEKLREDALEAGMPERGHPSTVPYDRQEWADNRHAGCSRGGYAVGL